MLKTPKPKISVPKKCKQSKKQKNEYTPQIQLKVSDMSKILLLMESLKDNTSKELEKKINKYLQREAKSEFSFLIVVTNDEACVRVVGVKKLESVQKFKIKKNIVDRVIAECSAPSCKYLGELHPQFQNVVKSVLKNLKCEIHTVPVIPKSCSHVSVIMVCLVNSRKDLSYILHLVNETFLFCLPILLNTHYSDVESEIKTECQMLLSITKKFFIHLGNLTQLLKEIMDAAKNLMEAERCALFLLEDDSTDTLKAHVFDGSSLEINKEVRLSTYTSIAGYVVRTGKTLNIKDPYANPLFYKDLDLQTGFKTRNILCFPISVDGVVIGSAEICNKKIGDFTFADEEAAKTFSIYCGLSIMNTMLFKKSREAQIKNQLCNDLMIYQMKVDESAVNELLQQRLEPTLCRYEKINSLPREIPIKQTPTYVMVMFRRLKLIENFNIKPDRLARFILYIQRGYRDVAYHNWSHALSVTHFGYLMIKHYQLIDRGIISDLEAMALLTSCLGHDIDHRGTTNAFQLKTESILANLYANEGSVMERHHFAQTVTVLNSENCNFLDSLDNKSYRRCLFFMNKYIVATDLGNHIKLLPKFAEFCKTTFNSEDRSHRKLMFAIMMTCADLSDQSKGWKTCKQVAKIIYKEFFKQGDMEKQLGTKPIEMMDRDVACIPDLQIQFLNGICIPAFKILAHIFPGAQRFVDTMNAVVRCWEQFKTSGQQLVIDEDGEDLKSNVNMDSRMKFLSESVEGLTF